MANHYINFLADRLAKAGIKFNIEENGFSLEAEKDVIRKNHLLVDEVLKNGHELYDVYKNRLDCVVPL